MFVPASQLAAIGAPAASVCDQVCHENF